MKEIRAVIRMEKMRDVLDALENNGHPGVSVERIEGHGRQARLDIVCTDEDVDDLVKLIAGIAKTGEIGDGKIFIYPVENAMRIRTGETGEAAI